jgi:hypothetical protein
MRFSGSIDWTADEKAGIDTRVRMEHGLFYKETDRNYCSSCGINSLKRSDLVTVLRRVDGNARGHGWSYCPKHLAEWIKFGANYERWATPMTPDEKLARIASYAWEAENASLSTEMLSLVIASAVSHPGVEVVTED